METFGNWLFIILAIAGIIFIVYYLGIRKKGKEIGQKIDEKVDEIKKEVHKKIEEVKEEIKKKHS